MVGNKHNILIVEDDVDVAEMVDAYFRVQGYAVTTVHWGEDALRSCRHKRPDLIILDIRLPDIDGFEVARQLRATRRTEDIPIIFLTEKRGRTDILEGLSLGADDYITKPFDIQELRLRVRNSLKRIRQASLNNPVTGLPEGTIVDERLVEVINNREWGLIGICLENLDVFREIYGFVASDDVLRAISLMVRNAVRDAGTSADFIGHVSSFELVVVTRRTAMPTLCERLKSRLDQSLEYFYPLEDRLDHPVPSEKRLSLHINIVEPKSRTYKSLDQIKTALVSH